MIEGLDPERRNVVDTYRRLAEGFEGTEFLETAQFLACRSPFAHPVANFAIGMAWDEPALDELRAFAPHAGLQVYDLAPEAGSSQLLRGHGGLAFGYRLQAMAADPKPGEPARLTRADTSAERLALAQFILSQFQGTRGADVRRQSIARSTAECAAFDLYGAFGGLVPRPVGAVMLHRSAGVVGLYNLCVATAHRGRGVGSAIVEDVLAIAGAPVVLQCDPSLAPWYGLLGFRDTISIDAYSRLHARGA